MKKNEGKPEPTLVYPSLVYAIARVRRFGINKHGSEDGWKTTKHIQHLDALLRHVLAATEAYKHRLEEGADLDALDHESGLDHLAHAACNIMFLIEANYMEDTEDESVQS
jgi:hypothetical protein